FRSQHIEQLLKCMDATDISGAASQPANAAKVVIQLFQQGRPHAMPVWHEAAAVQHFNKFQGSLGLGPRAEDSLLAAVMSVSSTLSEPNGLQELSKRVFEKWGEIRSTLSDEEMLCAAATHRKVQICFFDLDKEQPAPPVTINEAMVDIIALSTFSAEQYPTLLYLHRRGAPCLAEEAGFTSDEEAPQPQAPCGRRIVVDEDEDAAADEMEDELDVQVSMVFKGLSRSPCNVVDAASIASFTSFRKVSSFSTYMALSDGNSMSIIAG
ncbi:MAG: hypothetical protein FRX49_13657, partial [Trebouxia sp. A1-2]